VEYGEWVTGHRTESFIFGLGQFFLKVALGVGAGLFGWLLQHVGYVANVPQSPETLAGIKWIMVGLPSAGLIVAGLTMLLYPMKKGSHESIIDQLAARKAVEQGSLEPHLRQ
jgi:GPH family glycoside/pentoside/hexuronide:cation symporter